MKIQKIAIFCLKESKRVGLSFIMIRYQSSLKTKLSQPVHRYWFVKPLFTITGVA